MPFPTVTFASELAATPVVLKELRQLTALLEAYLAVEHNSDGTHQTLTPLVRTPFGTVSHNMAINGSTLTYLTRGSAGNIIRVTAATSTPYVDSVQEDAIRSLPTNGETLLVVNASGSSFTVKHDSGGTYARQRLYCPNSSDFTANANSTFQLVYDTTSQRWRVTGKT